MRVGIQPANICYTDFSLTASPHSPQNFRVLITSQPEDGIESAFLAAESVIIKHMNDHELQQRITTFSPFSGRDSLPHDFKQYGEALATRAEGLFQWAVAACEDILEPDP